MTMLIRSPEDIFRAEGKDVYFLHFHGWQEVDKAEQTRQEMQDWFAQNLPCTRTELIAPSEASGFVMGGPVGLRIDFSEQGLAAFCERWEEPATGKSLDPRFQCFLMPYANWFAKHGHFVPTLNKPEHVGPAVWIDTPLGLLTHVLSPQVAKQTPEHPAHYLDLWMHAVKLWPALQALDADALTYGRVLSSPEEPSGWWVMYSDVYSTSFDAVRKAEVLAWLGLPADTRMMVLQAAQALSAALKAAAVAHDAQWMAMGAALHDVGKLLYVQEVSGPGSEHEAAGEALLLKAGVPAHLARCCVTHGQWQNCEALESLCVALADRLWRGARCPELELRVIDAAAERKGRTHRSNALKRVAPTRFTHTRATRRSLALAVQRLIDASTRFKLVPIRRSRWSLTLALQGWPDAVRVQVSAHSLALVGGRRRWHSARRGLRRGELADWRHSMKVFLDDERSTPEGWVRVHWPDEANALLQTGQVTEISLDHDLGDDARGTGYDVVLWIEEAVHLRGFVPPSMHVHSANSAARVRMLAGIASIELIRNSKI
eukprot:gene1838-1803_t